ncbi:MAG TPA: hypothetical protein EYH50_03645 [Pyrodictium delaneyi]|uniref:Uncharacterized protein n=1 Tax=Pyrodictium delaneyi TaxID=1273541 RepID=A0A833EAZ7_9CREN|nr:hypothetical protein [Pyrodictium delaneyi]
MAVPPAAEQPKIVEAWKGVTEYWYEEFRRAIVIRDANGCIVISLDVYSRLNALPPEYRVEGRLEADSSVEVLYVNASAIAEKIQGVKPEKIELTIIRTVVDKEERYEVSDVRITCCKCRNLSYDDVYRVYRSVVEVIEQRDPETSPLTPPQPVEKVYRARLAKR